MLAGSTKIYWPDAVWRNILARPIDTTHYLPAEDYIQPIKTLGSYTTLIVLSIGEHVPGLRGIIIRNFVTRGLRCLESIHRVWELGNFQDCWTLHRSLVERLFTLRALNDRNEFETFDKWSYVRQFESKNRILSDAELSKKLLPTERSFSEKEKDRYAEIKRENISWKRPNPRQVAKKMNLSFLYSLAYDYASTHVHPMATDGEDDFLILARSISEPHYDQRVVLHNSIIIQLLLVQEGMKASRLLWRGIVQDFLFDYTSLLSTGSGEYLTTFKTIVSLPPGFDLCEPVKEGFDES